MQISPELVYLIKQVPISYAVDNTEIYSQIQTYFKNKRKKFLLYESNKLKIKQTQNILIEIWAKWDIEKKCCAFSYN